MGDSFSFANPHARDSKHNNGGTSEGLAHGHGFGEGLGHTYGSSYGSGAPWDQGYLQDGLGPSPDDVVHMAEAEMQRLIGTDGPTTSWLYSDYMQPAGAHEPAAQTPVQPAAKSAPVQRKMTVGSANDPLEEEADAVADRVMRDSSSCYLSKEQIAEIQAKRKAEGPQADAAPKVARQKGVRTSSGRIVDSSSCYLSKEQIAEIQAKHKAKDSQANAAPKISRNLAGMDEDAEETLAATHAFEKTEEEDNLGKTTSVYMQREAAASPEGGEVSPELQSRIEGVRNSGGSQLPDTEREFFESRMGRDFSDVRIHTGSDAAEVSRDVNAKAFTIGRDVVFGEGEYKPGTDAGRRLMAHELTHTVQQGAAAKLQRSPSDQALPVESEARQKKANEGRPPIPHLDIAEIIVKEVSERWDPTVSTGVVGDAMEVGSYMGKGMKWLNVFGRIISGLDDLESLGADTIMYLQREKHRHLLIWGTAADILLQEKELINQSNALLAAEKRDTLNLIEGGDLSDKQVRTLRGKIKALNRFNGRILMPATEQLMAAAQIVVRRNSTEQQIRVAVERYLQIAYNYGSVPKYPGMQIGREQKIRSEIQFATNLGRALVSTIEDNAIVGTLTKATPIPLSEQVFQNVRGPDTTIRALWSQFQDMRANRVLAPDWHMQYIFEIIKYNTPDKL